MGRCRSGENVAREYNTQPYHSLRHHCKQIVVVYCVASAERCVSTLGNSEAICDRFNNTLELCVGNITCSHIDTHMHTHTQQQN